MLGHNLKLCGVSEHIPDRAGVLAKAGEKANGKGNYTGPPSTGGVSGLREQCPLVTCTGLLTQPCCCPHSDVAFSSVLLSVDL